MLLRHEIGPEMKLAARLLGMNSLKQLTIVAYPLRHSSEQGSGSSQLIMLAGRDMDMSFCLQEGDE